MSEIHALVLLMLVLLLVPFLWAVIIIAQWVKKRRKGA